MATPAPHSAEKTLDLLLMIAECGGDAPLKGLAEQAGIPAATAYRLMLPLLSRGFVQRGLYGRYLLGPSFARLAAGVDQNAVLAGACRRELRRIATRFHATAHLGVWENDMVTYIAKEGASSHAVFTREGMQLEAYCSAIGKVLLANLPEKQRERYLGEGSFVRLTATTICDPAALRAQLCDIRHRGWALDDAEIAEDLKCVSVPISGADGAICAAISLAVPAPRLKDEFQRSALAALRAAADGIRQSLSRS